jgi:hypothetical protein
MEQETFVLSLARGIINGDVSAGDVLKCRRIIMELFGKERLKRVPPPYLIEAVYAYAAHDIRNFMQTLLFALPHTEEPKGS